MNKEILCIKSITESKKSCLKVVESAFSKMHWKVQNEICKEVQNLDGIPSTIRLKISLKTTTDIARF